MTHAYPLELRERVVAAIVEGGSTLEEASETFSIHVRSVSLWLKRWREQGTLAPSPHGGGAPRKLTADAEGWLAQWLAQDCDLTQDQVVERLEKRGVEVDRSTVSRALARMKWTRKKKVSSRPNSSRPKSRSSAGRGRRSKSRR
jgi:transposase